MSEHWFDAPGDDDLHAELIRVLAEVDPTPDEVYAQARARFVEAAQELRQGRFPVPALPVQLPSRAAVLDSTAPLGHQTALAGGEAGAQGARAAGAVRAGCGRPGPENTAPVRLRLAGRYLAWVAAAPLIAWFVWTAVQIGFLLYLT